MRAGAREPRPDAVVAGRVLREARLARGLDLVAAAEELCIRPVYLEALEAGRASDLVLGYARGFLRAYARHVGLDPDPLLAALLARPGAGIDGAGDARARRAGPLRLVVAAAGLALAAAAYIGRDVMHPPGTDAVPGPVVAPHGTGRDLQPQSAPARAMPRPVGNGAAGLSSAGSWLPADVPGDGASQRSRRRGAEP